MINDATFLYNLESTNAVVTVGDERDVSIENIGLLDIEVKNLDGTIQTITLKKVAHVPVLMCNLLSVTRALSSGFKISSKDEVITLKKGDIKMDCHKKYKLADGFLCGPEAEMVFPKSRSFLSKNVLHKKLGHPGQDAVVRTAKNLEIKIEDDFEVCEDCELAKARRKNLVKCTPKPLVIAGERLYLDISWTEHTSMGGSKYWVLAVDEMSKYCWSHFIGQKSDMPEKVLYLLKELKNKNIEVKKIRCDNAGENYSLKDLCVAEGIKVIFEFTPRDTPQHNGVVERAFQTLYNKVRATMNAAGMDDSM